MKSYAGAKIISITITMSKHIAIIGGGASAALLLANLARRTGADQLKADLYDREGRFARGVAYSTTRPEHLLNVRAGNMSAYEDKPEDFLEWLGGTYGTLDFVPRTIFGDYLEEKLEEAAAIVSVEFITRDAEACTPQSVTTSHGTKTYDLVVLATGNCAPLKPDAPDKTEHYYSDPWGAPYEGLAGLKDITLIGSGLSAVDTILTLDAAGFKGVIRVISRNGLFPGVHADPASYDPFLKQMPRTALEALHWVRKEERRAAAENIPWQPVIDSLRIYTNEIWQGWDEAQRRIFMRRLFTFWNIHRHRRAPQTEEVFARLRGEGRLIMVRACADAVEDGPKVLTRGGAIGTDAVINCLGYRYSEGRCDFAPAETIGPARFGPLFETTAIPEIRAQARELAAKILIYNKDL